MLVQCVVCFRLTNIGVGKVVIVCVCVYNVCYGVVPLSHVLTTEVLCIVQQAVLEIYPLPLLEIFMYVSCCGRSLHARKDVDRKLQNHQYWILLKSLKYCVSTSYPLLLPHIPHLTFPHPSPPLPLPLPPLHQHAATSSTSPSARACTSRVSRSRCTHEAAVPTWRTWRSNR